MISVLQWQKEHEGRTCEQFTQFMIDNDPERQAKGVQLYLEENGIGEGIIIL